MTLFRTIHRRTLPSADIAPDIADVTPAPEPGVEPAPRLLAALNSAESGAGLSPPVDVRAHIQALIDLLASYLPAQVAGLPQNAVGLRSVSHRALGLGGRRGMYSVSGMDVAELRGGWLDGIVRFDIWARSLAQANAASNDLHARLLGDGPRLRRNGLLQLSLTGSEEERQSDSPEVWRRSTDYKVLYEYQFEDTDGAASLIARIPITGATDMGPPGGEHTEVRDWMVRWDATSAPDLELVPPARGALTVRGFSIAAYLPNGGAAGSVTETIVRSTGTTTTSFSTLPAFLAAFTLENAPLELVFPPAPLAPGETQEIHKYAVGERKLDPPVVLKGGGDLYRISFSGPAFAPDDRSVVYLRGITR